jgi:hypothetical protein
MTGLGCDGEKLCEYLDGELSPTEHAQMEAHLRECTACRDELDALRSAARAMAALPRPKVSEKIAAHVHQAVAKISAEKKIPPPATLLREVRARPRSAWFAAAASVVMFGAAGLVAYWLSSPFFQTASEMPLAQKAPEASNVFADAPKKVLLPHAADKETATAAPCVAPKEREERRPAGDFLPKAKIKKDFHLPSAKPTPNSFPDAPPAPIGHSGQSVGKFEADGEKTDLDANMANLADGKVAVRLRETLKERTHEDPIGADANAKTSAVAESAAVGMAQKQHMNPADATYSKTDAIPAQVVFRATNQPAAVGALEDMVRNCGGRVVAMDSFGKKTVSSSTVAAAVSGGRKSAPAELARGAQATAPKASTERKKEAAFFEKEELRKRTETDKALTPGTAVAQNEAAYALAASKLPADDEAAGEKAQQPLTPWTMKIRVPRRRAEEFIENFRLLQAHVLLNETADKIAKDRLQEPAESAYGRRNEQAKDSLATKSALEVTKSGFPQAENAALETGEPDEVWFELVIEIQPL